MNIGKESHKKVSKVLWKASARRLNLSQAYNQMLFCYPRGKVSFKAETQQLDETIDSFYNAIYQRRNGGSWRTEDSSIFRRAGALWIHGHMISQILHETPEDAETYPLYVGEMDKLRVQIIRRRERAIALIVRNWGCPLHNSQLPKISDALREAERILIKQGAKKVFKVLMTDSIELKGRENLDHPNYNDIIFYPIPYSTPKKLDNAVEKRTGIPVRKYYPAPERWSKPIRSLLRSWIKRLLKVKKRTKMIIREVNKTLIAQFQAYLKLRMEEREGKGEPSSKWAYSENVEQKSMDITKPFLHLAPPPPSKPLPPQKIKIFKPPDPFKVRIYTFKKRNKKGIMRTYSSLLFYKVRFVIEKRCMCLRKYVGFKHIRLNVDAYRTLYGSEKALNDMCYSLTQYRPRDAFKQREKERALKGYLRELARS